MQIHNNTLIAECSVYDFKEILEHKKVKSWLILGTKISLGMDT